MNRFAKNWVILGIISLALSGIISPLLIIGRTIDNADGTALKDYFQLSINMHVNYSVLMWLLSTTMAYFNYVRHGRSSFSFWLAVGSTVAITLSNLGTGEAYSNNYIPIFDNTLFKAGIFFFLASIAYESISFLRRKPEYKTGTVAVLILIAMAAFVATYLPIRDQISSHSFYETLFWGGGHILQFAYVQIMLIAWLLLAPHAAMNIGIGEKWIKIFLLLPVFFVIATTIYIYSAVAVDTAEHITMFTQQMIFGNSLAAVPIGFMLFLALLRNLNRFKNPYYLALFFSFCLFTLGGTLGTKAAHAVSNGEITTIIPAHYHGSVIAVTMALMGLIYLILPSIGGRHVTNKWAGIQLSLYGVGQIMHIAGLAILGGHGAQRKTVGLDYMNLSESTEKLVKFAMHGGGGLVAIGGFLFVLLTLKVLFSKDKTTV